MDHKITKTKIETTKDNSVNAETSEKTQSKTENKNDTKQTIVYPGYVLADSMEVLPGAGAFREGSKIISKIVGIARTYGSVISVNALSGIYNPQPRDYVIAEVTDIGFSNWSIDVGGPYDAMMSTNDVREFVERNGDLTKYYDIGDLLFCVVSGVTKTKFVNVSTKDPKARKLKGKNAIVSIRQKEFISWLGFNITNIPIQPIIKAKIILRVIFSFINMPANIDIKIGYVY